MRDYTRVNQYIRARTIRLIDETGEQVGIKPLTDALNIARKKGLDLVEIAPKASPPVCKIISYSKYRYEKNRKLKEEYKKQKSGKILKEIHVRPRISEHDLEFKINHAREFLADKRKVRISVFFAGREIQHADLGFSLVNKIKEKLGEIAEVEQEPKLQGHRIIVLFSPKK